MKTSFEFSDNVLGIILEHKMDHYNLKQIQQMLQEKIEKYNEINVYVEDRNNDGITLKAVFKDLLFEMKQKDSLRKIAVVTDAKLFQLFTEVKKMLVDAQVESFEKEERMKAMNWVME
ncbi:SpoIIAA family protein [Salinimicrobium sp. CAU 1759]